MKGDSSRGYRVGAALVRGLLRQRAPSRFLTWGSKVWLRHARLKRHIETADYDAIVDGGANIGEFARLVRMVRPDLPLLCVEPHPESARILRSAGFRVVEAALWETSGRLVLTQPTAQTTSCTVVGSSGPAAPGWEVDAVRLQDLDIPGSRILIKLDLQGAEPQALLGMGPLWERCQALLIEVSYGPRGTYETIRALLRDHGFVESATFNELDGDDGPLEADKLWRRLDASGASSAGNQSGIR